MAKRSTNWDDGLQVGRVVSGGTGYEKFAVFTGPGGAGTATLSAVADSASSATLLASNTSRLGATIENDSSARLYVKLGATASTTSYSVSLDQYGYYEVPFGYTGRIDGIWASDPGDGGARITELTD